LFSSCFISNLGITIYLRQDLLKRRQNFFQGNELFNTPPPFQSKYAKIAQKDRIIYILAPQAEIALDSPCLPTPIGLFFCKRLAGSVGISILLYREMKMARKVAQQFSLNIE